MATYNNPYIMQDVSNIINAFTTPGKGQEIIEDYLYPGKQAFQKVKTIGGQYSYAMAQEKLQGYMDNAKGAVEAFYAYGTGNNQDSKPGQIAGIEFQNTILTIANSGSIYEDGATILADCIPCKDRILALLSLNPLEDLWNALDNLYELQTRFLFDLWDFFLGDKSIRFFSDLCSLLQFLNFHCVPDLINIVLVLSQLIAKYTLELKDIKVTLSDLLGKMFAPTLGPIMALFDKYTQLIIAPIKCIIDSLDANLQKLDVLEAWQVAQNSKQRGGSFDRLDSKKITGDLALASGLTELRKSMQEGVDYVEGKIEDLNAQINKFLGLEQETNSQLFNIALKIEKVSNYIGLVQGIILAIQQGKIICGQEGTGKEELETLINNYINPAFDTQININDGNIEITPDMPHLDGLDELMEIIGKYQKKKENPDNPKTKSTLRIPIQNCLNVIDNSELDAVKDYLSTFE